MTNPVVAYGRWLADTPRTWPEAALASAHRQVIDVIAVAIPGAGEPATRRVLEAKFRVGLFVNPYPA